MSTCAKCGGYFSVTKQTMFCPECEKSNLSTVSNCDIPVPQGFGKYEGWICPVCGRGVAPWVDYCSCQINRNITYASGTGTIGTYVNGDLSEYAKYATINCNNADLLESD